MTITRDQFIRGFNVLRDHYAGRRAVEDAAMNAGFQDFCMGSSPAAHELEQQLVEQCRAREDENGPWPEDCPGEDEISLALHWADWPIRTPSGGTLPAHPTTAEAIWDRWEQDQTGPFRPRREASDRDNAAALIRPVLDDFAEEVAQAALGKASAKQARRLHAKNAAVNRLLEIIR